MKWLEIIQVWISFYEVEHVGAIMPEVHTFFFIWLVSMLVFLYSPVLITAVSFFFGLGFCMFYYKSLSKRPVYSRLWGVVAFSGIVIEYLLVFIAIWAFVFGRMFRQVGSFLEFVADTVSWTAPYVPSYRTGEFCLSIKFDLLFLAFFLFTILLFSAVLLIYRNTVVDLRILGFFFILRAACFLAFFLFGFYYCIALLFYAGAYCIYRRVVFLEVKPVVVSCTAVLLVFLLVKTGAERADLFLGSTFNTSVAVGESILNNLDAATTFQAKRDILQKYVTWVENGWRDGQLPYWFYWIIYAAQASDLQLLQHSINNFIYYQAELIEQGGPVLWEKAAATLDPSRDDYTNFRRATADFLEMQLQLFSHGLERFPPVGSRANFHVVKTESQREFDLCVSPKTTDKERHLHCRRAAFLFMKASSLEMGYGFGH